MRAYPTSLKDLILREWRLKLMKGRDNSYFLIER